MSLHPTTFDYLKPSQAQVDKMARARKGFFVLAALLDELVPEGPDKTYALRHLRETGMWVNIAITRQPDGSPRQGSGE